MADLEAETAKLDSLKEIAARHGRTQGSIRGNLYRSRKKRYQRLREEGVSV